MHGQSVVGMEGPLAPYAAGFVVDLVARGYRPRSVSGQLELMAHVSRWLAAQGLGPGGLTQEEAGRFLAVRRESHVSLRSWRALGPLVVHLRGLQVVPEPVTAAETPVERLLASYRGYLVRERGLTAGSIAHWERVARLFLVERCEPLEGALRQLTAGEVTGFVVARCARGRCSGSAAKALTGGLRSLLRYLHVVGLTEIALAAAVPRAAGWRPATGQQVGVDVGVTTFAALCTGELIPGPRALCASQRALKRSQRNLDRKRKGSRRRQEARGQLARTHERVQRQRKAHAHATARVLVDGFDLIAMEDLRIANMTRSARGTSEQPETNVAAKGGLNRSILDAGWAQFTRLLDEKATAAGRQLVRVAAHHTSQTCHECGHVDAGNRRTQALFCCVACGPTAHGDTNAAQNILRSARGPAWRATSEVARRSGDPPHPERSHDSGDGGGIETSTTTSIRVPL